jgi:hypothetical protein
MWVLKTAGVALRPPSLAASYVDSHALESAVNGSAVDGVVGS